jgi:hypothetical protein
LRDHDHPRLRLLAIREVDEVGRRLGEEDVLGRFRDADDLDPGLVALLQPEPLAERILP